LQDATVYAQSLAVSGAVVAIAKAAVRRPRPLAYAGDPLAIRDPDSYRSFFSGHATLTFAALTTAAWNIRLRHGEQVWPWVLTSVVGASVGVERVLAGRHFPSDVLAGALTGAAIGTAVPLLHERSRGDGGGSRGALVPTRYGFAFSGRF
jgi:membrane-associated phospholipid phosphatase